MEAVSKLRACDKFGASVRLRADGKASYQTLGGGAISIMLQMLILSFFCL